MKTEQEVRAELAKKLRIAEVPDDQWDWLVRKRWVSGIFDGESTFKEVLDELRDMRRSFGLNGGRRSAAPHRRQVELPPRILALNDEEELRARLRDEWLAREARRTPRVQSFRRRWFPGYAKTAEERQAFLERASMPELRDAELAEVVAWLVEDYPWRQAQAEAFVWHDAVPKVDPVIAWTEVTQNATYRHGRIMLEVEPWVSEDTVRRTYRFIQGSMLPGKNRPLLRRVLEAARFALARRNRIGSSAITAETLREWEKVAPALEQAIGAEPGSFRFKDQDSMRRAVKTAEARILRPDYQSLNERANGEKARVEWRNFED